MSVPLETPPSVNAYAVALPAVHRKVTVEELNVDPGAGLTITAGPAVGVGVTVAVGLGVTVGVGLGVTDGVTVAVGVGVGEPKGTAWIRATNGSGSPVRVSIQTGIAGTVEFVGSAIP